MYQIQLATTKDIPVIQALAAKIWTVTYSSILSPEQMEFMMDMMYSDQSLEQQMTEKEHQFIIMTDEEAPIAYAAYSKTDDAAIYKLHKIYLDPAYQGKGAGKFLLNTVADQVAAKGATILELDVNRFNKALHFYERMGFSVIKEKNTDIGNGYLMEDYVMQKPLK
ncbi:N-acetylglutamate synthase-like GNAT family acetyltransferase [Chitinophaga dinghuensis]|uniref:N-acetylglutamate synthase-like GNAT family acetyltransferase n=1 Tax=Chitinophaga dinghuensis TaxID=1539050 RepID=A0A327W443_9BACT|nr:GNAT family N-acetyltransferase [Chitinophaga dinghuensis]RAJ83433.1 N-acetylglutamate synthase-like GNAT family acetyltransferase [Chitinophaga dinghuensis]